MRKKLILLFSLITSMNLLCGCNKSISDGDKNYVKDGEEYVEEINLEQAEDNSSKDVEPLYFETLEPGRHVVEVHENEQKKYFEREHDYEKAYSYTFNKKVYDVDMYKYYRNIVVPEGYELVDFQYDSYFKRNIYIFVNVETVKVPIYYDVELNSLYAYPGKFGEVVKENTLILGD